MKKILLAVVITFALTSKGHSQIQLTETNLKIGSSTQQAPVVDIAGSLMRLLTPGAFSIQAKSISQVCDHQIKFGLYDNLGLSFFAQRTHTGFHLSKQALAESIGLINVPEIDTCLINGDDGAPCTNLGVFHVNDVYFAYLTPNSPYGVSLGSSKNPFRNVFAKQYYATGSTSVLAASDSRLKRNLRKLSYGLDAVLMMNPTMFDFIPQEEDAITDSLNRKNKIGFIAQEIKEIVPEVVEYLPQVDRFAMDYGALIPVLVKAIQEQQAMIELLKTRVSELEAR